MSINDMYKQRKLEDYKVPDTIPDFCNDCNYFKKTGIIDRYRGHCNFYDEDRHSNWACIAHDYLRDAKETTHAIEMERDINQRISPKKVASNDNENSLFSFKGRIRRSTFWAVIIPILLINIVLGLLIYMSLDRGATVGFTFISLIFSIPATWVVFATYIKRCHDLNRSGWIVLTLFIPFANILILLYLGLARGTTGSNKYGEEIKK